MVPLMPGILSSVIISICPTHMFYLVLFLLPPNLTISSNILFPTFLTFLLLYHSQIGPTRVCLILMIFLSLVCLLLFSLKFSDNGPRSAVNLYLKPNLLLPLVFLTNLYLKPGLLLPFLQMPQVLTSYSNSMLHITSNKVLSFMVRTGTYYTYNQDNSGYV